MSHQDFLSRIESKEAVVGIVGLGYVGLPLAITFGRAGLPVIGFDIDQTKIDALERGESYLRHIPAEPLVAMRDKFSATTDFSRIAECDAILLCVPTPLSKNREPDISYVANTAETIGEFVRKGQLIILESTTYPGTTDELLSEIIERRSGLKSGEDFYLAYSPEREDPGNPNFETQTIPKVVGSESAEGREISVALYGAALDKVIPVSSTRVAEMTKLVENIFRSVNIALVNELKVVCDAMEIDVWEVIDAAATKPFGYMPFYPGPGLGGHCIPIDPFYLTWKAREYELSTRFIELAGEVNVAMPSYVVTRIADALNMRQQKAVNGANILLLGLAYKKDVDDVRESPALKLLELLGERGANLSYHDPYVAETKPTRHYNLDYRSKPLTEDLLQSADAVVIVTDHSDIDYAWVAQHSKLVVDTRNALRHVENRDNIIKA